MAAQISQDQIRAAERDMEALIQSDGDFQKKVREGKIKFTVIPGEQKSILKRVDLTNPEQVRAYGGGSLFNTPQEAEHFTAGFGQQPTRDGGFSTVAERFVIPRTQHQIHDPIRNYTRGLIPDVAADALTTVPKLAAPFLPLGPIGAAGIELAGDIAARGIDEISGEEMLKQTLPTIGVDAALAGLSKAGADYYKEDNVRTRQLRKEIANSLKIPKENVTDDMIKSVMATYNPSIKYEGPIGNSVAGYEIRNKIANKLGIAPEAVSDELLEMVINPLQNPTKEVPAYTVEDWTKQSLTNFDINTGAKNEQIYMKRPPNVFEPGTKLGTTSTKPASRNKTPKWTDQQWDAVARRFKADAGIENAPIEDIIDFIKKAYFRRQSDLGLVFYSSKETPEGYTKEKWVKDKALEKNRAAAELLRKNAYFKDPEMQKAYDSAMDEFKIRMAKTGGKNLTTPIVSQETFSKAGRIMTPKAYEKTGNYSFKLPFIRIGKEPLEFSYRPMVRFGAAALPIAAMAATPYILKALPIGKD